MNAEQKDQIRELHSSGLGYKKIAAQLGLSVNTVASFCKRQRGSESCPHCPQCGRSVVQTPHRKPKRFCSTQCHNTWWNHHAVSGNGKLQQLCPICKEPFLPIPVRTENIVPVFAMGSTERKWLMEKEHYHKIITYQTTVSILKSWMRAGLVTPEEFQKINTIIAERSGISLCSIFLDSCPIVR